MLLNAPRGGVGMIILHQEDFTAAVIQGVPIFLSVKDGTELMLIYNLERVFRVMGWIESERGGH